MIKIKFTKADICLLKSFSKNLELEIVSDIEIAVNLTVDETKHGFNTIGFVCGDLHVLAYLDTRYEAGGPYQLTSESRHALESVVRAKEQVKDTLVHGSIHPKRG